MNSTTSTTSLNDFLDRMDTSDLLSSPCLDLYKRVRRIYLNPNERMNNIDEIMKSARISYRTYQRKRPIAELQIFDPGKFDQVLQRCLMGENRTRLNQDFLDQNCQQNLDRPDIKMKRRAAIAAAGSWFRILFVWNILFFGNLNILSMLNKLNYLNDSSHLFKYIYEFSTNFTM